jgi:eukaryotic-like serine/threonine-protein kinase
MGADDRPIDPLASTWAADPRCADLSLSETSRGEVSTHVDSRALPTIGVEGPDGPPTREIQLLRVLGSGGMGEVHLARQNSIGREVAVKRVREIPQREAAEAALIHEAKLTGALEHPNVVPVHALGRDDQGTPFFMMKRVEGVSLHELIHQPEHPAWVELVGRWGDRTSVLVEILTHISNALSFAHARNILHRDVKPENVMVGSFGEVYLVDWGIATNRSDERRSGGLIGTPCYLAPEMLAGPEDPDHQGGLDERTDVYLLGATLHESLVGAPRHAGKTLAKVLDSALRSDPFEYPPDVPQELAELANAATARDKGSRPQSAAEFRRRLAEFKLHRSSRALSDAAETSLHFEHSTASRRGDALDDPDTQRQRYRAMSEARFGFRQALREWPENEAALLGLRRVLARMIELEIAAESTSGAHALFEELVETGPLDSDAIALSSKIAELEAELARRRDKEARLAELQRQMDPAATAKARAAGFAVLFVIALGLAAAATLTADGDARDARSLLLSDLAGFAAFALIVWFARKKLQSNEMGRRLTWTALLQSGFFVLTDFLVVVHGGSVVDAMAYRTIGMASAFGALAIMVIPASKWHMLWLTVCAFAIVLVPPHLATWIGMGTILGLLALSAYLFATGRIKLRAGDTLGE